MVRSRGTLIKHVVRGADGRVRGWYVYYLVPGGSHRCCRSAPTNATQEMLDHLLRHAYDAGSAGIQGRLEGARQEPLAQRRALFHQSGFLVLIHAQDRAVSHAIQAGHAPHAPRRRVLDGASPRAVPVNVLLVAEESAGIQVLRMVAGSEHDLARS